MNRQRPSVSHPSGGRPGTSPPSMGHRGMGHPSASRTSARLLRWSVGLLAGGVLAMLVNIPPGRAADPAPPRPAQPISWTWSTVQADPSQPRGLAEFERACVVCHGDGPAKPGTRALHTKYQGKEPALLAKRTDLAPDYIRFIVRHGVSVMPPFRKTELSDADLDNVVAYLTRKRR